MAVWELLLGTGSFVAKAAAGARAALAFGGDLKKLEADLKALQAATGDTKGFAKTQQALKLAAAASRSQAAQAIAAANANKAAGATAREQSLAKIKVGEAERKALVAARRDAIRLKKDELALQKSSQAKPASSTGEQLAQLKNIYAWSTKATLAVAALAAAVVAFGLHAANSARSANLLALNLTGSTKAANEFARTIDYATKFTDVSRAELGAMAKEFRLLRFDARGTQLAIHSVAMATTAVGEGGGAAIKSLLTTSHAMRRFTLGARDLYGEYEALKGTGLSKADLFAALAKNLGRSVKTIEDDLRRGRITFKQGAKGLEAALAAKFGGTIQMQLMGLENQFQRARENIGLLFRNVNADPFLKALNTVLRLLDQNTAGGKAVQKFVTIAFNSVGRAIETVMPYARAFFIGLAIGALNFYAAIKPAIAFIQKLLFSGGESQLITTLKVAKTLVYGVGAAFVLAMVPVAMLGLAVYGVIKTFAALYGIGLRVGTAISDAVTGIRKRFAGMSFSEIAMNLLKSLADGIAKGAGIVWDAIKGLGKGILKAISGALEIGSPSKAMRRMGRWTIEGLERGIVDETPSVQKAMVTVNRTVLEGGNGGVTNNSASKSIVINIMSGAFPITIGKGDEGAGARVRREISRVFHEAESGGFAMEGAV